MMFHEMIAVFRIPRVAADAILYVRYYRRRERARRFLGTV
jgi:hypothetical protein